MFGSEQTLGFGPVLQRTVRSIFRASQNIAVDKHADLCLMLFFYQMDGWIDKRKTGRERSRCITCLKPELLA